MLKEKTKFSVSDFCVKSFKILFIVSFTLILFNVIFNRGVYDYLAPVLILLGLIVAGIIFFLYSKFSSEWAEKNYQAILLVLGGALFVIELLFISLLRFDPIYDLEAVFKGAISWVETGNFTDYDSNTCHNDYFYIFPNNLGCLYLMFIVLKAAFFLGISDFFMVMSIFNAVIIFGTMLLSAGIATRLFSKKEGLLCASLFLLSPPFWFLAPVFYTDSLTMIFPVAAWYCLLRTDDCKKKLPMVLLYLLSSLLVCVGGLIKPTVWIVFIAIVIIELLRKRWLRLSLLIPTALSLFIITNIAFNAAFSAHIDKEFAEQKNLPVEYWLSIGLSGNGDYRNDYFQIAMGPEGSEAKKAALRPIIKGDLENQGITGLLKLFTTKTTRAFGDGTYASSDFLDDRPVRTNALHKFLLYDSEHYSLYSHIATSVLLALITFAILGMFKSSVDLRQLTAPLCLFGLMLFLMVWEVNARYILNFVPFIFISASFGVKTLSESRNLRHIFHIERFYTLC